MGPVELQARARHPQQVPAMRAVLQPGEDRRPERPAEGSAPVQPRLSGVTPIRPRQAAPPRPSRVW